MQRSIFNRFLSALMAVLVTASSGESALSPMMTPGADAVSNGQPEAAEMAATADVNSNVSRSTSNLGLPRTPITMNFHEADIRDILRLLALKSRVNIIYGADVTGNLTLNLDRVPFDQAFQTVLTLKGLVAIPTGNRIIRVVSSTALTAEQAQATMFTKVYRLNYANASEVKTPVDAVRSAAGRKGISSVDSKSNALVITDTPEGLQQAEDLVRELDKKPQQVDIEAKIVEVTLDDTLRLGVSWQFAGKGGGGANNNRFQIGTSDAQDDPLPGTQGTNTGRIPIGPSTDNSLGTGVALNPITTTGLSFLTGDANYLLGVQLAALQDKGKVKILSSPHIVTLNNEEAKINVVNQVAYRTTTQNGTSTTENVQFADGGVKLTVRPTINSDRRITMKVKPEVSEATLGTNGLPLLSTRNAETSVSVRDGETIAIGGLIKEKDDENVSGIPLLMNIPVLGYLFKTKTKTKNRIELIVFITPRIAGE